MDRKRDMRRRAAERVCVSEEMLCHFDTVSKHTPWITVLRVEVKCLFIAANAIDRFSVNVSLNTDCRYFRCRSLLLSPFLSLRLPFPPFCPFHCTRHVARRPLFASALTVMCNRTITKNYYTCIQLNTYLLMFASLPNVHRSPAFQFRLDINYYRVAFFFIDSPHCMYAPVQTIARRLAPCAHGAAGEKSDRGRGRERSQSSEISSIIRIAGLCYFGLSLYFGRLSATISVN